MSIRAIDTQMMITRSADMVRETSPLLKNPETFQSQLANVAKQEAEQNQSKVQGTEEAEMDNVRADKDGSGSGAAGGGGSGHRDAGSVEQDEEPGLEVGIKRNDFLIDITV